MKIIPSQDFDDSRRFSGSAPAEDRRISGERIITTLLIGRVVTEYGDTICRIRNVSNGGAKLETPLPLYPDRPIYFEMRGHPPMAATVRWANEQGVGISFDEPLDHRQLLNPPLPSRGWYARMPRLDVASLALARHGALAETVCVADINPRGARILIGEAMPPWREVTLELPQLPPRRSLLCWRREVEMGIYFPEPIPFGSLSRWLTDQELRFSALG